MPGQIRVAQSVSLQEDAAKQKYLHNRWHPEIPSIASIKPGETVKIECLDWTGGQILNSDSADDVRDVNLAAVHYLTGPFSIPGSEPGDVLVVHVADIQPLQAWGFSGIFARSNGGGFLDAQYPDACKAIWDFEGAYAASRHVPRVRFAGAPHPGIMGCAPSKALLAEWNRREGELIAEARRRESELIAGSNRREGELIAERNRREDELDTCTHTRVVAWPPSEQDAHVGAAQGEAAARIAREGARTIPGRPEHGGNVDINNISRGAVVYLPVHVAGAKFSVGDLHFSQGDGEISFCGAIEMAGTITLKFDLIKHGVTERVIPSPVYRPGDVAQQFGPARYLTFEGFSVDESGRQHYLDATVAYRQACLRAIAYLKQFGYSGEQAYILLSCAPVKGSIAGIVDIPNACTTLSIPMDIFDFDISVEAERVTRDLGACPISPSK